MNISFLVFQKFKMFMWIEIFYCTTFNTFINRFYERIK